MGGGRPGRAPRPLPLRPVRHRDQPPGGPDRGPAGRPLSWATGGLDDAALAALSHELTPSELWSLLLDVLGKRAAARQPAGLLRQWERDGFTRPAPVDQRTLLALDAHLLASAPGFEALELSPLAPLGACSVVGLTSQNRVVSALRGTELVADPTNLLALECARRLREDASRTVRVATCHRCVRAQEIPSRPGFTRHFRIFCLATAGREEKDHAFVVEAVVEHIETHLAALHRLEAHGYAFPDRSVTLLATAQRGPLADRIAGGVRGAPVVGGVLDHAYYDGLRFTIQARSPEGLAVPLIDGGAFDWVARLTSNRRLVFVASGMGSQLAASLFHMGGTPGCSMEPQEGDH